MTEQTSLWSRYDQDFFAGNIPEISSTLLTGIYELKYHNKREEFYLHRLGNNFQLPTNMLELDENFIARVRKSFYCLDKGFGVLMTGIKGTGKTVTAKKICNDLALPVILIPCTFEYEFAGFLNNITQNVIIMVDEFEKIYNRQSDRSSNSTTELLTLMDGVFSTKYKRLFLLTSNTTDISDGLLARPSRIRYVKNYGDLSKQDILYVVESTLVDHRLKDEVLKLLSTSNTVSIDMVKAIVQEVNTYQRCDKEFFKDFNMQEIEKNYDLFADAAHTDLVVHNAKFSFFAPGGDLRKAGSWLAEIDNIDEVNQTMILETSSLIFKKVMVDDKAFVYYREGSQIHESFKEPE